MRLDNYSKMPLDEHHPAYCSDRCNYTSSLLCMLLNTPPVMPVQKLYVAEYDLAFFKHREYMVRHLRKTKLQHPPGDEIYRNGNVSMVRRCVCLL